MKLILLSPPDSRENETEVITELFQDGLELFHLRKPGFNEDEMEEYVLSIPAEFHSRIVIHSCYSLIEKYCLKGIHTNKPVEEKFKNKVISRSVHSLEEIIALKENYEYVFLSPVFDSISKPGYKGKIDLSEAKIFLENTSLKIIALGGIDETNIRLVSDAGFSGAALLGAIWNTHNPVEKFKKITNTCLTVLS